ncbi:MAG: 2-oxo acid dehydrogenase subunit E2 [Synergistales bacterium]|nr:2-oxo acid dehydrogenase subunit E2 [Synergistales bacterium]
MATFITMPKLGLTMNEGTVTAWRVAEGAAVEKGEIVADIATDKLTYELEAPAEGELARILAAEGDTVPVGAKLAVVAAAGEPIDEAVTEAPGTETGTAAVGTRPGPSAPEGCKKLDVAQPVGGDARATPAAEKWAEILGIDLAAVSSSEAEGPVTRDDVLQAWSPRRASPLAKKLAREHGLAVEEIPGSGPLGRTVHRDVLRYLEERTGRVPKATPAAAKLAAQHGLDLASIPAEGRIRKEDVLAAAGQQTTPQDPEPVAQEAGERPGERRIPVSQMRKVIGERMSLSNRTIPGVTYQADVDCAGLIELRNRLKGAVEQQGARLSFNDIVMKVLAKALGEHRLCNARLEEEAFVLQDDVNIGLAVAVEGGLVVPNVKAVQARTLAEVAAATDDLVHRAREGALTMDDITGGTFTLTNLGMFGVRSFTPVINPPEAAILGLTAMEERPAAEGGAIVARTLCTLCLTADHRIVDGADAARFLQRLRELLETPSLLLV